MNSNEPHKATGYAAVAPPPFVAARAPGSCQWLWIAGVVVLITLLAVTTARYQRSQADRKRRGVRRRRRARDMRPDNTNGAEPDPPVGSRVAPRECQSCGSPLPSANPRRRYCDDACRMRFNRNRDQVGRAAR